MPNEPSRAAEAETRNFWDKKARKNIDNPIRAVGVDDPAMNRCIESAQQVLVTRGIKAAAADLEKRGSAAIDLGCGVGRWVPLLNEYFAEYHGVDISEEMLGIARREHPDSMFSVLSRLEIDAPEERFDFALCIAVLHHNSYSNQEVLLRELHRVIKPGGQLLLLESNGERTIGADNVFYPRRMHDWVSTAEHADFRLLKASGTCYSLVSNVGSMVLGENRIKNGLVGRALMNIDRVVMPHLAPLLPGRFHERLLMRFERPERAQAT